MPPSFDSTLCVSEDSKAKSFYATSLCNSLIKNTPANQHCVDDKDNEQLQSLPDNFCDVFPDDLPSGLPLERTIMHSINLLSGCKLISWSTYHLSASEASEVEK